MRRSHHSIPFLTGLRVVYLAIAVLFAQGVQMHVHVYDHASTITDHAHQGYVHMASETDGTHADEVTDIDLSNPGVVKKISLDALSIALITAAIVLLVLPIYTRISWRRDHRVPFLPWRGSQPPPLRAPPL